MFVWPHGADLRLSKPGGLASGVLPARLPAACRRRSVCEVLRNVCCRCHRCLGVIHTLSLGRAAVRLAGATGCRQCQQLIQLHGCQVSGGIGCTVRASRQGAGLPPLLLPPPCMLLVVLCCRLGAALLAVQCTAKRGTQARTLKGAAVAGCSLPRSSVEGRAWGGWWTAAAAGHRPCCAGQAGSASGGVSWQLAAVPQPNPVGSAASCRQHTKHPAPAIRGVGRAVGGRWQRLVCRAAALLRLLCMLHVLQRECTRCSCAAKWGQARRPSLRSGKVPCRRNVLQHVACGCVRAGRSSFGWRRPAAQRATQAPA